jgi:predicted regulator of Ras-like GTPase activity (Roadblock/LC7/MglB family)
MTQREALAYFDVGDLTEFETLMARFLEDARVSSVLLCDRTGRLLTAVGDTRGFDRTTFASLAAADFGASDQLAALLGESEFASLYHHGEQSCMYLADLDGWAILAAVFDGRTTLGMVRLKLKPLLPVLAARFAQLAGDGARQRPVLDAGWGASAEDEIDRLFSEG